MIGCEPPLDKNFQADPVLPVNDGAQPENDQWQLRMPLHLQIIGHVLLFRSCSFGIRAMQGSDLIFDFNF